MSQPNAPMIKAARAIVPRCFSIRETFPADRIFQVDNSDQRGLPPFSTRMCPRVWSAVYRTCFRGPSGRSKAQASVSGVAPAKSRFRDYKSWLTDRLAESVSRQVSFGRPLNRAWERLGKEHFVHHLPMYSGWVLSGHLSHSVFTYHINLAPDVTDITVHIVNCIPKGDDGREKQYADCPGPGNAELVGHRTVWGHPCQRAVAPVYQIHPYPGQEAILFWDSFL